MNREALRSAFLLLAVGVAAFGDTLVVPNDEASAAGNISIQVDATASRFQEIVGGGQFPGPIVITGIRLRAAAGTGPVRFNYASLKVTLSTTQAYPNTINGHQLPSTTYADNMGPDATTVFNGPFSASSPGCSAPGPCPFDMVVLLTSPFSFDPSKGRLLVDFVTSDTNPTGSLDGVGFPDSSSSTVAIVTGDPTQATGNPALAGLVLGLMSGTQTINSLSGSFGFLASSSYVAPTGNNGWAMLGVMNFDGAGNASGTYTAQFAGGPPQVPTATGTFTGAIVITDGGNGFQLVATSCSGSGCDVAGTLISGFARAAYAGGSPNGTYGFQLSITPNAAAGIGTASFDGAGNVTLAGSFVGPGQGQSPVTQAQVSTQTQTGTYSMNPNGSGKMSFSPQEFGLVMVDGGSAVLVLQLHRSGNGVQFGVARLQ